MVVFCLQAALDAEKALLLELIPAAEYEEGKLKLQILKNSTDPTASKMSHKPRSGDMVRYHTIAKVSETDVFTKEADEKLNPDDGVRFGAIFQNTRETRIPREVVMGGNDDAREYRGDYIKVGGVDGCDGARGRMRHAYRCSGSLHCRPTSHILDAATLRGGS